MSLWRSGNRYFRREDSNMELIYLRIQKSKIGINEEEINFSNKFDVKVNKAKIIIEEKESDIYNIFGDKISNLSLIVGKNGTGKTTILESIFTNGQYKKSHLSSFHTLLIYYVDEIMVSGEKCNLFWIEFDSYISKRFEGLTKSGLYYQLRGKLCKADLRKKEIYGVEFKENASLVCYLGLQQNIKRVSMKDYYDSTLESVNLTKTAVKNGKISDLIYFINNSDNIVNKPELEFRISSYLPYRSNAQLFYIYHGLINEFDNFDSYMDQFNLKNIRAYNVQNRLFFPQFKYKHFIINYLERKLLNIIEELKITTNEELIRILDRIVKVRYRYYDYEYPISYWDEIILSYEKDLFPYFGDYYRESYNDSIDIFLNKRESFLIDAINELINRTDELIKFKKTIGAMREILNYGQINSSEKLKWKMNIEQIDNEENYWLIQDIADYASDIEVKLSKLSDGQGVYCNTFATIFSILNNKNFTDKIIILDEPDSNLHPEWSRNFINDLKNLIDNYLLKGKVQIIITTHSPYIVSDVFKNSVFNLIDKVDINKDNKERRNGQRVLIKNAKVSFGANIFDLMSDSFFMEATIGEFAKNTILEISKQQLLDSQIINNIDDSVLRGMLKKR